jgi:hypothetical protein
VAARVRRAGGREVKKLTERVRQIGWTGAYLEDVRSDLSVLHRIDDLEAMPGPRVFAYVWRLTAYQGVITNMWRRQQAERGAGGQSGGKRSVSLAEWMRERPDVVKKAHELLAGRGR